MSEFARLSVLVLEDDAFQRDVLVAGLRRLGVGTVTEAEDGRAGLAVLARCGGAVDVVICDLQMEGMDGIEFSRHVSDYPIGGLIFCSAHGEAVLGSAEWMAKAYKLPLLGVLPKPIRSQALTELLRSGMTGAGMLSSFIGGPPPSDDGMLDEIRGALDTGQFVPFYQPKVDIASARILGAEILARWDHWERGIVGPVQFIQVMERHGLIDALTLSLLDQACAHLASWSAAAPDFTLALNVSPLMLEKPGSAAALLARMAAQGVAPERFVVEITEQAFAGDVGNLIENVIRLRMRGCGISIDDFGTGYSSLAQVSRVPLTEIKLDRQFVRGVPHRAKEQSIVESTLDLARRLKVKVVAEGVETPAERECLRALGCDIGQGYLFARPMPADAMAAALAEPMAMAA